MTHTVTKRGRAPRRGVEMGQHLPCQYQGRHHRNLPAYSAPVADRYLATTNDRFNRCFDLPIWFRRWRKSL